MRKRASECRPEAGGRWRRSRALHGVASTRSPLSLIGGKAPRRRTMATLPTRPTRSCCKTQWRAPSRSKSAPLACRSATCTLRLCVFGWARPAAKRGIPMCRSCCTFCAFGRRLGPCQRRHPHRPRAVRPAPAMLRAMVATVADGANTGERWDGERRADGQTQRPATSPCRLCWRRCRGR